MEFPDQELEHVDGAWVLRIGHRLETEDQNAAMSLAANLAVADALFAAGTGLFRVMADPDTRSIERLRHTAHAFGLMWPADQSLADFRRTLDRTDPRGNAFLVAVRRAGGGASYERLDGDGADDRRGTRRWPPRTPTPRRRCAGWPTGTSSRRPSPSPPGSPSTSASRRRSPTSRR